MKIDDFDYELPKELIAQYPSEKRGESNLLVLHRDTQEIEHRKFYNIVEYLGSGDALILNETKVIPARLIGKRVDTDGKVEVFLLNPVQVGENSICADEWKVLISPHRAKKVGVKIEFGPDFYGEVKNIIRKPIFKFYCRGEVTSPLQGIYKYGRVPLPPYIKREPESMDYERYQTVYAKVAGACAAPTAGLHFTHSILNELKKKGVEIVKIVLHTGVGSFKLIKCENVEDHQMEPEYYEISENAATKINLAKRRVAVGTTTVRALESVAIEASSCVCPTKGWTDKFIYPPYKFKVVDALITNFHLPKSTLLLLICAFAGWSEAEIPHLRGKELIFKAYKEAIARRYRFYSYGDAMLII